MTITVICYTCEKEWQTDKRKDATPWRVVYDFCGVCQKSMIAKFERQMERRRLTTKLRVEQEDDGA